ncbi:MAG: hypothetical protein IJ898_01425 [Prevotella sp.]|nr:hypothetical protein [Prevotella sp.]
MKKKVLFAAMALVALASCSTDEMIGVTGPQDNSPSGESNAIVFASAAQGVTRAGELTGATAAEKLGYMFVVEGTKGTEQGPGATPASANSPSTTVVFDNYLVGYDYNSAGRTESNTNNWEYVGLESGIEDKLSSATWSALHPSGTSAQVQTVKYWDYSVDQYDFIAWSTGACEAVPTPVPAEAAAPAPGKVQVTRINTGNTLSSNGFTMRASSADDLKQCYYTDIITVEKGVNGANYGKPVTLTFKNMAAKVRVALYETVPGYSVRDVYFYTSDENPAAPADLGDATTSEAAAATLFTMGSDKLPQSGSVLVYYPHIGTDNRGKVEGVDATYPTPAADYNKASVTVTPDDGTAVTTQAFGALTANYTGKESESTYEAAGNYYLGRTITTATFAGAKGDDYYTAVIPNTTGVVLTLRLDYKLVATDGSGETITVKGAKAVVPSTYTKWLPNYAYTYIFKISNNTNGYTGTKDDPTGLYPITFDAMVASFTEANAEQTTVTTVATPSITTYQQGHNHAAKNEYSLSQTAGASSDVKDIYVQVAKTDGSTPTLYADLTTAKKSLLFLVSEENASEAEVMDALQNRTNAWNDESPVGRNGITLTKNTNITNGVATIINGVDDQPIPVAANTTAKIDIENLTAGKTYAYVYSKTIPTEDKAVFNVVSDAEATDHPTNYYEVIMTASDGTANIITTGDALLNHVYFVKNLDKDNKFVSYTFKQTKVGESVVGLVDGGPIDIETKATEHHTNTSTNKYFYFDVYNQNDGEYAVKVIKVVN